MCAAEAAGADGGIDAGIAAVLDALDERVEAIAAESLQAIVAEIAPYEGAGAGPLADDIRAHAAANIAAFLGSVRAGHPPDRSELRFVIGAMDRRVGQGIALDAVLHAFRIGHRVVWDAIRRQAALLPNGAAVALELARPSMEYIDAISTLVAEAYLLAEQERAADADLAQRDELDVLLTGRSVPGGRIGADAEVLVIAARAAGAPGVVRRAVRKLARGPGGVGLAVASGRDEIVAVIPVEARDLERAVASVRGAVADMRAEGIELRAGVSLPGIAPGDVPRVRAEAAAALALTDGERSVLALPELSPFEYLLRFADDTARRMVPPAVRELCEAEQRTQRDLVATIVTWTRCDMNVRRAAELLHVHPNTVHHRLRRVEELTGADLHRLSEVVELVAAIRLLRGDLVSA